MGAYKFTDDDEYVHEEVGYQLVAADHLPLEEGSGNVAALRVAAYHRLGHSVAHHTDITSLKSPFNSQ